MNKEMSHLAEVPGTQVFNKCFFPSFTVEGVSRSRILCAWHLVGLDECM